MSAPEGPVVAVPLAIVDAMAAEMSESRVRFEASELGSRARTLRAELVALQIVGRGDLRGLAGWQLLGGQLTHFYTRSNDSLCGWAWASPDFRTDAPADAPRCSECARGYAHIEAHAASLVASLALTLPAPPDPDAYVPRVAKKGDKKGWGKVKSGKFHYFGESTRYSLCGRWVMHGVAPFDDSTDEHPDNCTECMRRLKKARPV